MDAVEEIKSRLSIEDVIGEYVQLKRAGRNWRGLSPFSNEKTPSFMVSPEKQIWHDFSSGKGGNMFSFVMEVEGLEFKGALELLARKAGIDIEQFRSPGRRGGSNKERLHALNELATKFYQVQFSKNQKALTYVLKERKFTKDTALTFRIGYSPNTGTALIDFAKSKGFSEAEIKQAGLSAQNYRGGVQDMFRGRLMIPLQDPQGMVVGFTARLLDDDPKAPKYINTSQTALYDKSRHIYGLHLAKEAIRKSQFAVMVEGNLDVIASHQAGVHQVVATAGTALTELQLKTLSRFTGDVRLAFDTDKAGVAATERAIPLASRVKISLGMIDIPAGKDPDELIRQNPKLWQSAVEKHDYALDWLIARYEKLLDVTSAAGKRQFSDVLLPVVRNLSDPVERDHYLNLIAKKIGVRIEALEQKFQTLPAPAAASRRRRVKVAPETLDHTAAENQKLQDAFLALMLVNQSLREYLTIVTEDMLYSPSGKALLKELKTKPGPNIKLMQNLEEYGKILTVVYEELYQGFETEELPNELEMEAARLQTRLVEQFVKTKKRKIAEALTEDKTADTRELLGQVKIYDELLNQVKGA